MCCVYSLMLELREMCGKMESIKHVTLTAELLKNSSRVLVRNIAAHYENAEILKMYFESNKSGGSENGVEDICLNENGIAVVTFVDPKGIMKLELGMQSPAHGLRVLGI